MDLSRQIGPEGWIRLNVIHKTLLTMRSCSTLSRLAKPGKGARQRACGGWALVYWAKATWSHWPVDSPPTGRGVGVGCFASWVAGKGGDLRHAVFWHLLKGLGTYFYRIKPSTCIDLNTVHVYEFLFQSNGISP